MQRNYEEGDEKFRWKVGGPYGMRPRHMSKELHNQNNYRFSEQKPVTTN
jgi:hypothetical protein